MKAMDVPPPVLDKIVRHINRKSWWHVPPRDSTAYLKRGKFLASSFAEAEFWGRPLDEPQKVKICYPLIGDEATIETRLLGRVISTNDISIERRWALDARIKKAAMKRGYDSIVLVTPKAFSALKNVGRLPGSMELNILDPVVESSD
jgi:hypothetical protein